METKIVQVVGRLKTMEVPPLRQLDVNVGVGVCWNGCVALFIFVLSLIFIFIFFGNVSFI